MDRTRRPMVLLIIQSRLRSYDSMTAAEPILSELGVCSGELLEGKYLVSDVIGRGGMGVVVAARHVQLDEPVAIKLLLPNALANQEAVSRFFREAKAAVKIKSNYVARVFDVGMLSTGLPYLVMEYLDGKDLGDWIADHGAIPIDTAVEFLLQACEAIAEAHSLGIVHRDLKPSNLFCTSGADGLPSIKVLDFGISKVTGHELLENDPARTDTKAVLGSPLYMSPEQLRSSRDVDIRTDIWSLGVILYESLTGTPPFTADTLPELIFRILNQEPASVREIRPEIQQGLAQVVGRCLSKELAQRYGDVAALAHALLPYAPTRASAMVERISRIVRYSSPAARVPTSSSPNNLQQTLTSWGKSRKLTAGHKRRALSLSLLVIAALLPATILIWFNTSNSHRMPEPTASASFLPQGSRPDTFASASQQAPAALSVAEPSLKPVDAGADGQTVVAPAKHFAEPPQPKQGRTTATKRSPSPSNPPAAVRLAVPPPDPFAEQH